MLTIRLYLSCFLILRGLTNLLVSLFLLELLSWGLVLIIDKFLSLKYLLIQSTFLFLRVLGAFIDNSFVLIRGIFLKIGLPPFHLWLIVLLRYFNKKILFLMLRFHKILPILLVSKVIRERVRTTMQLLLRAGGVCILQVSGVYFVFLVSSLVHSAWLIIRRLASSRLVLFYWVNYSVLIYLFLFSFKQTNIQKINLRQTSTIRVLWLILAGVPPFTVFWLKLSIFININYITILSILLILISIISISSYYRAYHLSINTENLNNSNTTPLVLLMLAVGIF